MAAVAAISLVLPKAVAQDDADATHLINVTIPNVALLDLETSASATINATFTAPTEAGNDITDPSSNSDLWLNYTSVLSSSATSRKVDVKASQTVDGVKMKVVAAAAATGFKGTVGTPESTVTLSTSDQALISGITSAYTTDGANKGHKLTYTFEADDSDFGSLKQATPAVTITYTLVDVN